MVPLQVIVYALLVFTAVQIGTPAHVSLHPLLIVSTVLVSHLALLAVVATRARHAAAVLHQPTAAAGQIAERLEKLFNLARWGTVALAAVQFWGLGWSDLVLAPHGWNLARGILAPLPGECILLLPMILTWLAFWAVSYDVELAIHQRSLAYRLAMGLPAHEMPRRGQFISLQARHNFFLLIPILLSSLLDQILSSRKGFWTQFSIPISLMIMLILVPWIITLIWRTSPMTGPLRDRLIGVARTYHVRFRNILIWHTHHHVRNAAVLGYLFFARYFLMSDALLESLTDRQIEAVFAHEVGHARHRHLWWYSLVFLGCGGVTYWAGNQASLWLPRLFGHAELFNSDALLGSSLQILILVGFTGLVFSRISKRFEHQADWFATQHMARRLQDQPLPEVPEFPPLSTLEAYAAGQNPSTPATTVSAAPPAIASPTATQGSVDTATMIRGADLFMDALRTIVELSYRSPDHGGWLHPSVRQRGHLLAQLARDLAARARFDARMFRTRLFILILAILGGLAIWPEIKSMI